MWKINFIVAVLSIFALSGTAATYFVSPSGSNSSEGTSNEPWATLDFALSRSFLAPGDTIQLRAGNYTSSASTKVSGLSNQPITIRGAGQGVTVLKAKLSIYHSDYIVRDLTVDGHTDGGNYTGAYLSLQGPNCRNVLVENCEFLRGITGASFQDVNDAFPTNVTVRGCNFHHPTGNGMVAVVGHGHVIEQNTFRDSAGNDAIRIFGPNHVIRSNKFYRIISPSTEGYSAVSTSSVAVGNGSKIFVVSSGLAFTRYDQVTITSSADSARTMAGFVTSYSGTTLVVDVYSSEGSGSAAEWRVVLASDGNHADTIQSFADSNAHPTTNLLFIANYSEDCTGQFGNLENNAANTLSGDWTICNNVFNRCRIQLNTYIPRVKIFNNTIYDTTGNTTGFRAAYSNNKGAGNGMMVLNNVFVRIDGSESGGGAFSFHESTAGCVAEYNLVTDMTGGSFSSMNEGPNSINGGYSNSQIIADASGANFRLASNSPARRKGMNLSQYGFDTDFNGTRRGGVWDMGAFSSALVESPSNLRTSEVQGNPE